MLHKIMTNDELESYEAGRDRHINGANTTNCNFRLFSTIDRMNAWEKGVADAKAQEQAP